MDTEKSQVTDEMLQETEEFWKDPQKILSLIDLLFLWEDTDKKRIYS